MSTRQFITYSLLIFTIIATAFCLEIGFYPLLQDTILDYRAAKETLALILSAAIFLWALSGGHRINCKNPWLLVLVLYLIVHPFISPKYELTMIGRNVGGFWEYQTLVTMFIYLGLFCVIANLKWQPYWTDVLFRVFMWIGLISAGYIFLQYFNLDEFQVLNPGNFATQTHGGKLVATFTQPNYSGSFIALMIPFAIYFRHWLYALAMGIAVILITSKMGILIMGTCFLLITFYKCRRVSYVLMAIPLGLITWFKSTHLTIVDSGRFPLWHRVIYDCIHPWLGPKAHPLLGHGLGFYHAIWAPTHNAMLEAHNEWIQLWMDGGLIADLLLIFSIFWLLKKLNMYRITDDQTITLLACFFGVLVGSLGLFIWQIEPHRLLTVILFAMLHHKLTMEEPTYEKS